MRLTIIAFIILLCACGSGNLRKGYQSINDTDSLVLVFDKIPDRKISGPSLLGASILSYIGQDGFPVFVDEVILKDTIKLPTINNYLEIAVLSNKIQYQYFYLAGGDTVMLSHNEHGVASATSKKSPNLTQMYNFTTNIDGAFNEDGLSPKAMSIVFRKKLDSILKNTYTPYINNYRKGLDSAIMSGLLDSIYCDYYKYQYRLSLRSYKYSDALVNDKMNASVINIKYAFLDDSLSHLISYYKEILPVYQNNGFDNILSDESIPDESKKLILYEMMRLWNIPGWLAKSPQELGDYYKKYTSSTRDSVVINKLMLQFNHPDNSNVSTKNMLLSDIFGETTDLGEVLNKNKGKVVYIDFWASWCAPCIAGMDDALKLRKEYQGKDVVFIYLALNDTKSKWRDAVQVYKIDFLGENYFIENPNDSEFISKLNVKAIPRFIIFDKTGRIINSNAPRPESNDIRRLLDKYLQ